MLSLDLDKDDRVSHGEWELFLAKLGSRDKAHAALAKRGQRRVLTLTAAEVTPVETLPRPRRAPYRLRGARAIECFNQMYTERQPGPRANQGCLRRLIDPGQNYNLKRVVAYSLVRISLIICSEPAFSAGSAVADGMT